MPLGVALALAHGRLLAAPSPDEVRLSHFKHDSFALEQGAPTDIMAIAQTPDGYLWLGAREGLYRFDGVSFERIDAPPSTPFANAGVVSLTVSRKGELWVGFNGHGGVAVYRHGGLVDMRMPDPPSQVTHIAEGEDGVLWAQWGGISRRLWRWEKGRWSLADGATGLPEGYGIALLRRGDGSLWMPIIAKDQHSADLAYLPVKRQRFIALGGDFQYPALGEDRHGHLWLADRRGLRMVHGVGLSPPPFRILYPAAPNTRLPSIAFDRWGGIWETTDGAGILRVADAERASANPGGKIDAYRAVDGLSGDDSQDVLVDREGDIWVGTGAGLDRFRYSSVSLKTGIPPSPVDGLYLASTLDGAVHMLSDGRLYDIAPGMAPRLRMSLPDARIICGARDNGLWVSDGAVIYKLTGKARREGSRLPDGAVNNCAEDGYGRLWVAAENGKIWWRDGRGWHQAGTAQNLIFGGTAIAINSASEVAFNLGSGVIGLANGNRQSRINLGRFGLGHVRSIDPAGRDFLVAMDEGIVRIREDKARALSASRFPWLAKLLSSVETEDGKTWFFGRGASLVRNADLDLAFQDPLRPLKRRLFDTQDGLPQKPQHLGFNGPQAKVTGDGRLWLATGAGIARINPQDMVQQIEPAPVVIRSLAFGQTLIRDPADLVLPAGTTSIQILYSSLRLGVPERVRFRFRLSGVDADWIDAGARRSTTYTNLSPGSYDFRVVTLDENGVEDGGGATLHFVIRPTFVQSWPFKLLCAVLIVLALWAAYRMRMKAVAENIRARMAERRDERERIARELHDTLLQSIHALILHVQAAADKLPSDGAARIALESALDRAQDAVMEGRDRVLALRLPTQVDDLEHMLVDVAHAQLGHLPIAHSIRAMGPARPLDPCVAKEIICIAHEALFNVVRHARATEVRIDIVYGRRTFEVRLADNGQGVCEAIVAAGFRTGHFGLIGMRERAEAMSGKLTLANRAEGGFQLSFTLPARMAYARRARKFSPLRLFRRREQAMGVGAAGPR